MDYGYTKSKPKEFPEKNIYDLFRMLVSRVTFSTEAEIGEWSKVIDNAQRMNMFGTTALRVTNKSEEN